MTAPADIPVCIRGISQGFTQRRATGLMADVKGRINLLQGPAPDRLVKPKMSTLNTKLSSGCVYKLTNTFMCV